MTPYRLTTKQRQILDIIKAKNADGSLIDLDELLDRLPYETSKQSIHFSIRALVARDLIVKKGQEKRRGRQRRLLDLGLAGQTYFGAASEPTSVNVIATQDEDDTDQLLGLV